MPELLIIMQEGVTAKQLENVISVIRSHRGHVRQQYPPRVIIARDDQDLSVKIKALEGVGAVHSAPVRNLEGLRLDSAGLQGVRAWNYRLSADYPAAAANLAGSVRGRRWNFPPPQPGGRGGDVDSDDEVDAVLMAGGGGVSGNTSRYLIGTVAVGVVIVEGPNPAALTQAERDLINAKVKDGTDILIQLLKQHVPGASLNFIFDPHTVTLASDPATAAQESVWLDPAMATLSNKLGYYAGNHPVYDYLHYLRTELWAGMASGPDWAYVAFFKKDPTPRTGYAHRLGGPYCVITYDHFDVRHDPRKTSGYTLADLDVLFAHETGHVFGAPDEYTNGSTCPGAGRPYGYLGVQNGNCEADVNQPVPCLMFGSFNALCQSTVGHFGWKDSDGDGVPDVCDPLGTYATDIGVDIDPQTGNADIWIRNQDDGEIPANQIHQNPRSDTDNFIYARIKNFGNVTAEIVRVQFYMERHKGADFVFPNDYNNRISSPEIPYPTLFLLRSGASLIVKVRLPQAQVPPQTWTNPCLLVHVSCVQDHPVPNGCLVKNSNNLAQKNLAINYVGL